MAFLRYARSINVTPHVRDWDRVRVASGSLKAGRDIIDQASKILQSDFDPKKFLLTHATIVASVDTEKVPKAKLGSSTEDGKKIVRKTTNFRIKSACDKYINNNLDSWARPVLLKSYKTFVGGHSFVEHVQIEKLSKGRIIDAVARDVGDSIYVDILVANDRKHEDLCAKIASGELSTLSMGCSIDGSTCTKCGHWAADETEFCDHIRYEKGNVFYDENGGKHRVAELCGDESLDPTGGVTFVEASWVETPAFTGAVARNVVEIDSGKKKAAEKVFASPAPVADPNARKKAARTGGFEDAPEEEEAAPEEEMAPPKKGPSESPLGGIENELKSVVLDGVKDQLKEELTKKKVEDQVLPPSDAPNDTVVKQARLAGKRAAYVASLRTLVATSTSDVELINRVATLNREIGVLLPVSIYRAALKVGARDLYREPAHFLKAVKKALGHAPSNEEVNTMVRLATLLADLPTARRTAETRAHKERLT